MSEALQNCEASGVNLYIVAGCGMPSVTGLQEQSDAIITVKSSTGSQTAPFGTRFSDGYLQKNAECSDSSHNHLSPSMTIDASTGYIPDYTWYIEGLYHGMTWKEPYAKDLCLKLMSSSEQIDVYTDPAYPQFKFAENNSYSVLAAFNKSSEGYLSGEDTALVVTNLSQKYPMRIMSIECSGTDLYFDLRKPVYLQPGEIKEISMTGYIPETSLTTADVCVTFTLIGSITPTNDRLFTYQIDNGPSLQYDEEQPFTAAHYETYADRFIPEAAKNTLQKTNLYYVFRMLLNALHSIIRMARVFSPFFSKAS